MAWYLVGKYLIVHIHLISWNVLIEKWLCYKKDKGFEWVAHVQNVSTQTSELYDLKYLALLS